MKKLFNSIFVIIAAMVTFAGCAKEEIAAPETKTVQFFAESIETKTAFGAPNGTTYPTLWTENDEKVKILLNLNEEMLADVTPSDDFKTASFSAKLELNDKAPSVAPFTFYAITPASAYLGKNTERFSVTIPNAQTPLENSVDEAAQILYAVSESFEELPSEVSLNFNHFTAYGKLSFKNLNLNGAKIESVALTSEVNIAGRWNYMIADGSFAENSGSSSITLNTDKTENIWFACAPADLSNTTLKVVVNTDKGTLTKEIDLTANHKFEAGKIAKFSIDMQGITFGKDVVYEIVTDAVELTPESEIIIVSAESELALSTTQNNNNRGQASVKKSGDGTTITNPGDDVQVITVEEGLVDGTVAFNVGGGYLYAASSGSNHLKTETTLDENGSWLVTISEGIASIVAQGANTRNILRYNDGNLIFSCYGSGQKDVAIYKLQGSGTVLENYLRVSTAAIDVTSDATSASFTVSSDLQWTVAVSSGATATVEGNKVTVSFAANTAEQAKTYTATVSASGVESKTVTITQAKKVVVDSNFEAGLYWIMGTKDGKTSVMTPLASDKKYGYASSVVVTNNTSTAANAFTFTAVSGGYTIQDASGRYYYQEEGTTYKTFNAGTDGSLAGCVWTVNIQNDGTALITNAASGKSIKFADGTYTSFGVYSESDSNTAVYPMLVKADSPATVELASIAVSGQSTSYNLGDTFSFNGTVKATYTDGSTKTVTPTSVSQPNMNEAGTQTVTVTYTEGNVTKTAEYTITIKDPNAGGSDDSGNTGGDDATSATISFEDVANRISQDDNSQVWTQNGITVTNEKGASTNKVADYSAPARFYKSSSLKVESATAMTKIDFACNSTTYATALQSSITAGGTVTVDGKIVTVVLSTASTSFNVASLTGGQVRMDSITVYYGN